MGTISRQHRLPQSPQTYKPQYPVSSAPSSPLGEISTASLDLNTDLSVSESRNLYLPFVILRQGLSIYNYSRTHDPPALTSRMLSVTGVCHHTWLRDLYFLKSSQELLSTGQMQASLGHWQEWRCQGLFLNPEQRMLCPWASVT